MAKSKDQIIEELQWEIEILKELVAWLAPFNQIDPEVANIGPAFVFIKNLEKEHGKPVKELFQQTPAKI